MKLSRPVALQCQANSLLPRGQNSLEHMGQGGESCGCSHMAQDNVVVGWDGGCEYPSWFFNSGLKKGGVNNSVFWHAEWIFVLCLKFREKNTTGQGVSSGWAMQDVAELSALSHFWGGQCHRTQLSQRFWCWHYQHFPKETNSSWEFPMNSYDVLISKCQCSQHFSYFILSAPLNSPFSIWDLLLLSWAQLWRSLYNTAVIFCPLKGFF